MHKLIVVGSGIKSIAHLTEEVKRVIQGSDKVLYLLNEEHQKQWIEREAKSAESLEPIYHQSDKRIDAYHRITQHIIDEYFKVKSLCVAFYGHPTVFAQSSLKAVKEIQATPAPAVSRPPPTALDSLFREGQIDPASQGCLASEATELVLYERKLDVYAHNILWQVSNLGRPDLEQSDKLAVLKKYLLSFYLKSYQICQYEAAKLPTQQPNISWYPLGELGQHPISHISTLYIPPSRNVVLSKKYLDLLQININDFTLSTDPHAAPK